MRMPDVLSNLVSGEQIDVLPALAATLELDPQEILNVCLPFAMNTLRFIKVADFTFHVADDFFGGPPELLAIDRRKLLPHNPIGHRVNVKADDVAAEAV